MRVDVNNVVLICFAVFVAYLCGSASSSSSSSSLLKDPFYGISPQDEKFYKTTADTIKCKDGSRKFTKAQLNDDFCDCPDGSDEPGTSACPNGKFYCRNAGHIPLSIFSSRVNDGICDCCDGSDEYDGKVKCSNTCWEAGKVARDKLKKKIATYQEGVALRKQEVEKAKVAVAKDEAELSKLKSEEKILKGLVQQLKERKELIEKAEEKERLQKEKEEKEKREAEEADKAESEAKEEIGKAEKVVDTEGKPSESTQDDKTGPLEEFSSPQEVAGDRDGDDIAAEVEHGTASENVESPVEGVEKENDVSENTEGLSREELGRLVASRWTGKNSEGHTGKDGAEDSNHDSHEEIPKDTDDEEDDGYASDTDDDTSRYDGESGKYDEESMADDETGKYDEESMADEADEAFEEDHDDASSSYKSNFDDNSDISDTTTTGWLEKIQQTVRSILQAVNLFQTPVDKSEAAHVRKEYDESSAKLSKIQSRISSLTQKLKHDFGPEREFYSFHNQCFESKQNKYVYKVCPYKQASQMEGHSTTRLGQWDKFEDSYRVMMFSEGDRCWNGPDRSLKVKLKCGLKNELTNVDEPSRCEYVALLSTPAVCVEEKLKELQDKLDALIKEEPGKHHDEL